MTVFTWKFNDSSLQEVSLFKRHILKRLVKRLPRDMTEAGAAVAGIETHLPAAGHSTYLHPALVTVAMLPDLFEMGTESQVLRTVERLVGRLGGGSSLAFGSDPDASEGIGWAQQSLRRQAAQLMGDLGDDPQMHLGHPEQANCEALTQEALVALEGVWPEMASLTKSLITHFVWFTSPTQWSSTEPTTFGAVYANPRSFWTMPYFFETLLHEGGHLHLMVKQTIDPLLINPNERTSSPLRADPRPLKGVLHAVFVLARMAEGLHRLAVAGGPVSTESAKMARINVERLGRGLQSLEGVARFTPAGHELFGSLRKAHLDLARKTA